MPKTKLFDRIKVSLSDNQKKSVATAYKKKRNHYFTVVKRRLNRQ